MIRATIKSLWIIWRIMLFHKFDFLYRFGIGKTKTTCVPLMSKFRHTILCAFFKTNVKIKDHSRHSKTILQTFSGGTRLFHFHSRSFTTHTKLLRIYSIIKHIPTCLRFHWEFSPALCNSFLVASDFSPFRMTFKCYNSAFIIR